MSKQVSRSDISKHQVVSLSKTLYPHCLVLVSTQEDLCNTQLKVSKYEEIDKQAIDNKWIGNFDNQIKIHWCYWI